MPSEPSGPDPRKLWQSQTTEYEPMTLAEIHEKSRTFQSRIRRRNALEYIGGAIVILAFLPVAFAPGSWMIQAGAAWSIAATAFVLWQLNLRGSARSVPETGEPMVDHFREALMRQRDAVRSVAVWYLAPFVPGLALILLGRWFQAHLPHRPLGTDHLIIGLNAVIMVLIFLVIWLLNLRGADRLQRRIDALGPENGQQTQQDIGEQGR